MTLTYREDIDWLRALAVLSVIGFHWQIPPFAGGYVGVDVFFVISGFLITGIIQSEMAAGTFTFARFYERRIRRLLPALYFMIVLVALPSFHFLLASERQEFFTSIAAVATFTSNIFFWWQKSYFSHLSEEKLLLHTWSLSVEEQFYLVLPLLVWALLKWSPAGQRRRVAMMAGLGISALASFALSYWLMQTDRTPAAFFLSPPRAWEFLAGSLIAIEGIPVATNVHLRRIAAGLGLAMIVAPAIGYREGSTFPGIGALLPCCGAAIYLWAGIGSGAPVRAIWSPLRIMSFVGRISYSLYLWHWPLYIYARFSKANLTPTPLEKVGLFALAVALSYVSYRFIEQPLRQKTLIPGRRAAFLAAAGSTLLLLLASIPGLMGLGAGVVDDRTRELQTYEDYPKAAETYRFGTCFVEDWKTYDEKTCLTMAAGKTNVLLWGDSWAAHFVRGLMAGVDPQRVNIMQMSVPNCFAVMAVPPNRSASCRQMGQRAAGFIAQNKPDLVIMSTDWLGNTRGMGFDAMIAGVENSLTELRKRNIPVAIVGPTLQYQSLLPLMLMRARVRGIDPQPEDMLLPETFTLDARMKSVLGSRDGVTYISLVSAMCPLGKCPLTLEGGVPLTWDHRHFTFEGSLYAGGLVAKAAGLPLAAPAK